MLFRSLRIPGRCLRGFARGPKLDDQRRLPEVLDHLEGAQRFGELRAQIGKHICEYPCPADVLQTLSSGRTRSAGPIRFADRLGNRKALRFQIVANLFSGPERLVRQLSPERKSETKAKPGEPVGRRQEIGRASCRERVSCCV